MESEQESEKLNIHRRLDELERMFPLKSTEQTLGHKAVLYANHHYAVALEMSQYDEETNEYQRYAVLDRAYTLSIYDQLVDVRQQVADIDPKHDDLFERYLNAIAPFYVVHSVKELEIELKTNLTWKKWLTEYASDEELLFFARVHNHVIETQQTSPFVEKAVADIRKEFVDIVDEHYQKGHLAKTVPSVEHVELRVSDIFDTAMEERTGYYQFGVDAIHIQQGFELGVIGRTAELLENLTYAATHELVHATLGESRKQFDSPLAARWVNEAMTENIAMAIDRKTARKDRPQSYLPERRLLHKVFSLTPDTALAYRLAMRAYSGSEEDRQEFLAYLDMSIGVTGALDRMNDVIGMEEHLIVGVDGTVDRAAELKAIERVDNRLRKMPSSLFIRYEEAVSVLQPIAAQE